MSAEAARAAAPVTQKELVSNTLGFAAFGFGARCFQLGIQKRPMFSAPLGHVATVTAFSALGYYLTFVEKRQEVLIAEKRAVLLKRREAEHSI